MKKMMKLILVLILIFFCFSTQAFAKFDYDIDLPSGYKKTSEDMYEKSENNKNYAIAISKYKKIHIDEKKDFYSTETLEKLLDALCDELLQFGNVTVLDRDISVFTENEYDCLKFDLKFDIGFGSEVYYRYYFVKNKKDVYLVYLATDETDYFESKECEKIIDSITIEGVMGKKQKIEFIWKTIAIIGFVLVGLVIIIGIYNMIREREIDRKATEILRQKELAERRNELERRRELKKQNEDEKKKYSDGETFTVNLEKINSENINLKNNNLEKEISNEKNVDLKDDNTLVVEMKELKNNRRICANCGQEIAIYWAYCNYCGHKMENED